jgi:hypothetical protein
MCRARQSGELASGKCRPLRQKTFSHRDKHRHSGRDRRRDLVMQALAFRFLCSELVEYCQRRGAVDSLPDHG